MPSLLATINQGAAGPRNQRRLQIRAERGRGERFLGLRPRPTDTHEIGERVKYIVAADFLGRVLAHCCHLVRMSLPVCSVDPNECRDGELMLRIDGSAVTRAAVKRVDILAVI